MPFPKIDVCIICEGARAEINGKFLLLGYYGIAPYVAITLTNVLRPAMVCFVFTGGGTTTSANYNLKLSVIDPNGVELATPQTAPDINGSLGPAAGTNIYFSFQGILGKVGRFKFALIVDGVRHYENTFEIKLAQQQVSRPN